MYGMYFWLVVFFVLQFIATYFGGGIIITISLHTYLCYFQQMYSNVEKNNLIIIKQRIVIRLHICYVWSGACYIKKNKKMVQLGMFGLHLLNFP